MYAVIRAGGKQYKVSDGEKLKIERRPENVGSEIVIKEILAVNDNGSVKIGNPLVHGAFVKATVIGHGRFEKIKVFKMRRRKHYQKHQGHRQQYTFLRIDAVQA